MMRINSIPSVMLKDDTTSFIPGISVDCVVFGFHENTLKVLLLSIQHQVERALPGGYIMHDESLEEAAARVLNERTGLTDVFLQQFHIFSSIDRVKMNFPAEPLKKLGFSDKVLEWLSNRFITTGFYALVDYMEAVPASDEFQHCAWYDLNETGILMMDHKDILLCALETLRLHLNHKPVGMNLLPEKFTMPELQKLYETILGKKLDRRNFQRKIESFNIIRDLGERKSGVAHKAPYLYSFDREKYIKALKEGLKGGW